MARLYTWAVYSSDAVVRRPTLGLLRSAPRREGAWDAILAAKRVTWLALMEVSSRDADELITE